MSTLTRRFIAVACILAALGGLGACSKSDDDAKDFCKKYRTFEDADKKLSRSDLQNAKDIDLQDAKDQFDKVAGQIDTLEGTSPDEIATSVEKVRSVVDSLNDKVQASKSPLDLAKALKSEADIAKDTSVQKAGDRVDTWIEDNCDSKGNTKN